jgi:hypothetical protein
MKTLQRSTALTLSLLASATPSWAGTSPPAETTTIQIGSHDVPVVKGGLYDRFRSNPPLSVIAAEAPDAGFQRVQRAMNADGTDTQALGCPRQTAAFHEDQQDFQLPKGDLFVDAVEHAGTPTRPCFQ